MKCCCGEEDLKPKPLTLNSSFHVLFHYPCITLQMVTLRDGSLLQGSWECPGLSGGRLVLWKLLLEMSL